ncbi:MAG: universal stress protein [Thermoplasmatota archaeon]
MKKYKRILVPVDGSKLSWLAFEQGSSLAKLVDGNVSIMHVIEIHYEAYPMPEGVSVLTAATLLRSETEEHVKKLMEEYQEYAQKEGVRTKVLVKEGHVANEIINESKGYDVVIMGTQGRNMLTSLLLGSTAEKVVRHAHCPVMLVREKME